MNITHCPICGLSFLEPIDESKLRHSYFICDCCGCEYGLDDTPAYRQRWIDRGAPWFHAQERPEDWDMAAQLANSDPNWNIDPKD